MNEQREMTQFRGRLAEVGHRERQRELRAGRQEERAPGGRIHQLTGGTCQTGTSAYDNSKQWQWRSSGSGRNVAGSTQWPSSSGAAENRGEKERERMAHLRPLEEGLRRLYSRAVAVVLGLLTLLLTLSPRRSDSPRMVH